MKTLCTLYSEFITACWESKFLRRLNTFSLSKLFIFDLGSTRRRQSRTIPSIPPEQINPNFWLQSRAKMAPSCPKTRLMILSYSQMYKYPSSPVVIKVSLIKPRHKNVTKIFSSSSSSLFIPVPFLSIWLRITVFIISASWQTRLSPNFPN